MFEVNEMDEQIILFMLQGLVRSGEARLGLVRRCGVWCGKAWHGLSGLGGEKT